MAGIETARTIAFSVRKMVVQPLQSVGAGVQIGAPIVLDTLDTAQLKLEVSLIEQRGGAYLYPLAIDPKESKLEISAKATDCPPMLSAVLIPGTYAKVTAPGATVDASGTTNIVGSSVGTRCTATVTGTPVSGRYAIVATGAQAYQVYDLNTGRPAAAVTTSASANTIDTASVTGITITTTFAPLTAFTAGDVGNFEVDLVGGSNTGEAAMETVTGGSTYPVTLPQCLIVVDATRRAVIYQWILYWGVLSGETVPMGTGKVVLHDLTVTAQQPPYNAPSIVPWRYRRIA